MVRVAPGKHHPAVPVLPAEAVVLGEAVVDLFPEEPGGTLEEADRLVRHLGGAGANLAVGLARQGVPAALVGLVGADAFGRFVRRALEAESVATDGLGVHRSARTGVCFASPGSRGERGFLCYRQPSADQLVSAADFAPAHISRGRLLCLGSATQVLAPARAATERALEIARGAQQLVFCDLNFRPHQFQDPHEALPLLRRLVARADVVKLSRDELLPLFGTDSPSEAAARARRLGPDVVVVTLGEAGCYADGPEGTVHVVAERLQAPLLDRTGAGDAFSAGFLAELLGALGPRSQGGAKERLRALPLQVLKRACVRGNWLGALCCTRVGATAGVPRADGVR
ncbi:MAG: carbohydrate kinase [Myxococcales bacterium]|nr:carbohydrate kinase [Myxococcota bacterium]MDW8282988.1 carbohydrate kinase [Myxococcales bacterium]